MAQYQYHSVTPTTLVPDGAQRVATTRPCGLGLGYISDEEMDFMAVSALHAGRDAWIVVTPRPLYGDEVADLYVS